MIIKETRENPEGWKIIEEPDEPQLVVKQENNKWTTEWTSKSNNHAERLPGSVLPDFLQELKNEDHGPAFDYYAAQDNSNELADESDYHFPTPIDNSDYLSHHQNTDTVQLTSDGAWQVKPNALLEMKANDIAIDNALKAQQASAKTSSAKSAVNADARKSARANKRGNAGQTNETLLEDIDSEIRKLVGFLETMNERPVNKSSKPKQDKQKAGKVVAAQPISVSGTMNMTYSPEGKVLSLTPVKKKPENSKRPNKGETERRSREDETEDEEDNDDEEEEDEGDEEDDTVSPVSNMVGGVMSGVQNLLQHKSGQQLPVTGAWALSYNDSKVGGKNIHLARNMVLRVNHSKNNQDWSLIYNKGGEGAMKVQQVSLPMVNVAQVTPAEDSDEDDRRQRFSMGSSGPKREDRQHSKDMVLTDKGWSLYKVNSTADGKKAKPVKKAKPSKTMIPTKDGWSVFSTRKDQTSKAKSGKESQALNLKPGSAWTIFQSTDHKDVKTPSLVLSSHGWITNDIVPKKETPTYNETFQPASVITIPDIPLKNESDDVNEKLLESSNEDSDNTNMLEDEKDEIDRTMKKGNAIELKSKNKTQAGKIASVAPKVVTKPLKNLSRNKTKEEKVMDTVRKVGLDKPKEALMDKYNRKVAPHNLPKKNRKKPRKLIKFNKSKSLKKARAQGKKANSGAMKKPTLFPGNKAKKKKVQVSRRPPLEMAGSAGSKESSVSRKNKEKPPASKGKGSSKKKPKKTTKNGPVPSKAVKPAPPKKTAKAVKSKRLKTPAKSSKGQSAKKMSHVQQKEQKGKKAKTVAAKAKQEKTHPKTVKMFNALVSPKKSKAGKAHTQSAKKSKTPAHPKKTKAVKAPAKSKKRRKGVLNPKKSKPASATAQKTKKAKAAKRPVQPKKSQPGKTVKAKKPKPTKSAQAKAAKPAGGNQTVSEQKMQASLHESLQSAMNGIVKVFNDEVEGRPLEAEEQNEKDSQEEEEASDILWTPWSEWGSCSVSCGRGWITRRRFCLTVTRKCDGRAIEMQFCNLKPCPGELFAIEACKNCAEISLSHGFQQLEAASGNGCRWVKSGIVRPEFDSPGVASIDSHSQPKKKKLFARIKENGFHDPHHNL